MNKSKKVILAASMATILAIGVGTSLAIGNNNAIRADAAATTYSYTAKDIMDLYGLVANKHDGFPGTDKTFADSGVTINVSTGAKSYEEVRVYGGESITLTAPENSYFTKLSYTHGKSAFSTIISEEGKWTEKSGTCTPAADTQPTKVELQASEQCRLKTLDITLDSLTPPTDPEFRVEQAKTSLHFEETTTLTVTPNSIYVGTPTLTINITKGSELVDVAIDGLTATFTTKKVAGDVEFDIIVADADGHTLTKKGALKVLDHDNVAAIKTLSSDTKVTFIGTVVDKTVNDVWLADNDGTGICFHSDNMASFDKLALNNEVLVKATTSNFHGKPQVNIASNDDITILGTKEYQPRLLANPNDIASMNDCGNFVRLDNLSFTGKPGNTDGECDFIFTADNKQTIKIHANKGEYDLKTAFINKVKDLPVNSKVSLVGIADRYDSKPQLKITKNLNVIKLEETLSAEGLAFAKSFLSDLTCDATGKTAPNQEKWLELKAKFDKLPAGDKAIYKKLSSSTSDEGKAVERYDYILTKYGKDTYVDFMDRNPSTSLTYTPFVENNEILIITMVAICVTTVSAIAIFAIVKHKKSQVK